jgi:hypothetical protein
MNIFVLDRDAKKAAQMQCDKHVVKMIVETCQMLSAVMDNNYSPLYSGNDNLKPSERFGTAGYPKAHIKHPCTMWTMQSKGNYKWLIKHLRALCVEYSNRYNKVHSCEGQLSIFEAQMEYMTFPSDRRTAFVQAMPDKYKDKDPVKAYHNYYNMDKFTFAKWKNSSKPKWFVGAPTYTVTLEDNYAALLD